MPKSPPPQAQAAAPALPITDGAAALAEVQPELVALAPSELRRVTANIPHAAAIALGAVPSLTALRPRIVRELPFHPIDTLDRLRIYALAAVQANVLTLAPDDPESPIKALLDEAAPLRQSLLIGADALVNAGLLDARRVAAIRAGRGNLDTAGDLSMLATLYREAWASISDKTAVTAAQVDRAAVLGPALLEALGARDHDARLPATPSALADQRTRAWTLLERAYAECHRAVAYLRAHEGDVEAIMPPLHGTAPKAHKPAPRAPETAAKAE